MKPKTRAFFLHITVFALSSLIFASSTYSGSTRVTTDGIQFPDGTTQTTAATGGAGLWTASGNNIYYNKGNVGIGTTDPVSKLEISNEDKDATYFASAYGNEQYMTASKFIGRRARGTSSTPTAVQSGDLLSYFGGKGYDGTSWEFLSTAGIQIIASENHSATSKGSRLEFLVTANGAANKSIRMVMSHDGNVGIGTKPTGYKLHVNGDAAGTSWTNLSSRDFKTDIRKVDEDSHPIMLAKLMHMEITTYKYKPEFGGDGEVKVGFISEDMPQEVLSRDGKGVDLYQLLAFTVGAMKAQQKEIAEQRKENEELKAELASILARLRTLER